MTDLLMVFAEKMRSRVCCTLRTQLAWCCGQMGEQDRQQGHRDRICLSTAPHVQRMLPMQGTEF